MYHFRLHSPIADIMLAGEKTSKKLQILSLASIHKLSEEGVQGV